MIWEKLLTDTDGQYVEVQSGRLFNQAAEDSTLTPFKHRGFAPYATDTWTEYWLPVKGTEGIVEATDLGALNVAAARRRARRPGVLAARARRRHARGLRRRPRRLHDAGRGEADRDRGR